MSGDAPIAAKPKPKPDAEERTPHSVFGRRGEKNYRPVDRRPALRRSAGSMLH